MIIIALAMIAVLVFALVLLFKLLKRPIKIIFKLLLNTLLGFVILIIFNFLGGFVDFSLDINFISAAVTGILGLPGVILLVLLKLLF